MATKLVKIKALRELRHDMVGLIAKDQVVEIPQLWADRYVENGWAEKYSTKVEKPKVETKPHVETPSETK